MSSSKPEKKTVDIQADNAPVSPEEERKNIRDLLIIVIGAFVGLGMVISVLVYVQNQTMNDTYDIYKNAEPIAISSTKLMSDYNDNISVADDSYRYKNLKITGEVSSVGKNLSGEPYINLKDDSQRSILPVKCTFPKGTDLSNYKKKQTVSVVGECDGQTFTVKILAEEVAPAS